MLTFQSCWSFAIATDLKSYHFLGCLLAFFACAFSMSMSQFFCLNAKFSRFVFQFFCGNKDIFGFFSSMDSEPSLGSGLVFTYEISQVGYTLIEMLFSSKQRCWKLVKNVHFCGMLVDLLRNGSRHGFSSSFSRASSSRL